MSDRPRDSERVDDRTLDELLDGIRAELAAAREAGIDPLAVRAPLEDLIEPDRAAGIPQSEKARRRGFALTPRRAFQMIAIALVIILVALLIFLLWFLGRPERLTDRPAFSGIQPVWQVYGPAVGETPIFSRPMGVAVGRNGRVYVTDSGNNRVCVFDPSGRFLFDFGQFGAIKPAAGAPMSYVPGALNFPVGIDTDAEGNVYVASLRNDSVEVYDRDGMPLRRFPDPLVVTGKGGSGLGGTGIAATDVAVHNDRVYVTDTYQILVFTLEGTLVGQWGRPGVERDSLDHPNGLTVGADGTVYVSDSNHHRVTAFTPNGDVLWQVGTISQGVTDKAERILELPRGLTVLDDGSILVADSFGFSLVRISPEGRVEQRYGERGIEPGQLNFGNDVEVLRGMIVIADRENGRVQLVRLIDR